MYFWKTKSLSEDIKSSVLTDEDWKKYYLAGSIILMLSLYLGSLAPRVNMESLLVEAITIIGVIIFGINISIVNKMENVL